ncbi:MAG: CPBP family intramembrane glutamic endopeptidase [Candidatus Korobacteraceae bacterium]
MSEPASSRPQSSNRTHNRTLLILGLLLNLFLALAPLGAWGDRIFGKRHLIGHEVFWWCAVLLMLGYVVFVEHRRMSSIGFRRPRVLDLVLATVFGILMVVGIVFIYRAVFPALHLQMNTGVMSSLLATPFWYRLLLVTRAAASEEILFRGYPIERLLELTGSRIVAAVLSWAAFTYAHLAGWGWAQLIVAGYGGVLLTILYLWRRNLWANMLAHWIADGAGFLMPH